MQRLKHVVRILGYVHLGLGPVVLIAVLVSKPWIIGDGRVHEVLRSLEDIDWRWWVLGVFAVLWAVPVIAVAGWLQARKAGLETASFRKRFEHLLEDKQLPISVHVDTRIPVEVQEPLAIPIEVNTRLAFDEALEIETTVPLRVDLPLDSVIETSVFGLGTIKVPIRANIPIDLVVPIKGKIRIKTDALPVHIKDQCIAKLPVFEVPIHSRFETRLSLLENLRTVRQELKKGVGEVLQQLEKKDE